MERGCSSATQQWSFEHYFHCYLSQRSKDPLFQVGLQAISLSPHRFSEIQEGFFHGCVLPMLAVWLFSGYWWVYRGTCTWVLPKLQSIMCNCGNVTNMCRGQYVWCMHTQTHSHIYIALAHTLLPAVCVSLSYHMCTQIHNKQGVMRTELLSGSAATKHNVASVIQAAENTQITTPSLEFQLACYEGLEKRCKTNNFRGGQRCTQGDLFELEQSPQCCCSVLDAQVYFQFQARHLSEEDWRCWKQHLLRWKIIISE